MGIQIGGLIGVVGGLLFGIIGWWIGRKQAEKERGLDELHDYIWSKARSYSWYATIAAIYLFFIIYLFGYELSLAMVLALLILVQLGSWAITGMVLSVTFSQESESRQTKTVTGILMILISFIVFFVLTVVTENWIFIVGIFLFGAIGVFMLISGLKKGEGGA